jgi:hypothetical protein
MILEALAVYALICYSIGNIKVKRRVKSQREIEEEQEEERNRPKSYEYHNCSNKDIQDWEDDDYYNRR